LALTALVCTTQFSLLLEAMRKFAAPRLLVMELAFLYRYIFVLIDEAMRVRRGRDFRGATRAPFSRRLAAVGGVVGALFVRTLDRSQRIHTAMCARGYRGQPHSLARLKFRTVDAVFLAAVAAYLFACRFLLHE
jgi:cobalt/nickel transport system permease protein